MTYLEPNLQKRARAAFIDNAPPNLLQVRDRVASKLTGSRRRDQLSALDTVARVMGIELSQVRAIPLEVRSLLASRNAIELDLSERRWRNVRSGVVSAVRAFGADRRSLSELVPLNSQWEDLLARIETTHHRDGLKRLARFCSALQIAPMNVEQQTLLAFHEALIAEELLRDPRTKLKHTIAIWNICHRKVSGWPKQSLVSPFERDFYALPLEAFPSSFQQDLKTWSERLLAPDPMDPSAPARPLKPISVQQKVQILRRFASALVHEKSLAIEAVTDLQVLVNDVERFKNGLRFFLKRFDNQPNSYIAQIANCLRSLARHYVELPEETSEAIELICKRLQPRRNKGLKAKNRERLAQFDDPENVARLLQFPEREAARGRTLANSYRAAKCFERAAAISLLLATGLRIKNLRTLRLEGDFTFVDTHTFLSIPGERVKNGMDLDFELPSETAAFLIEYRDQHRQQLPGSDGLYLFPGRDGGPRPHATISHDIQSALYKRAGLIMNPHLFRHVIAKIVIERDPGLAFTISRHLGHKSINTTMQSYLGTEGRAAARNIDRVLKDALDGPQKPGG